MATPGPSATQATNPETTALLQASIPQYSIPAQPLPHSKYSQLQALLEELGKEIRPTYAGNRMAMERLKKAIIRARILVREIQMEWSGTARSDGVIAVSLYELSEGDNLNRNGALIWHPLSSGSELAFDPCPVECALNCGVFRTCLASGPAAVWCALTDGSLAMCQVMEKTPQVRYEVSSTMLTGSDASTSKVASVDSAGFVRLTDISIGGELFAARAHSHDWIGAAGGDCEAWCCKLLNGDNLLATGGDDSKLCVFDVRSDVTAAAAVNRKCHTAGVTAIDVVPQNEHLIFTGSYDSYLRLFDTRKLTKPISVSEMLPGGIWHATKTPPYSETPCISSSEWIAACMQGGLARFRMDHTVSEGDVFQILELCDVDSTTDKQRQLVYGVASNRDCVYAASFYTNTLACFKV